MGLNKELPELVENGVISQETAERIREYQRKKKRDSGDRLPLIFGILGALLAGGGVLLIIAHNWSDLSRAWRTFFSFLPLVAAQGAACYVLLKKNGQRLWRESVGILLFLAVGASLSLVSQTYHLEGELASFLLIWMLLAAPIPYVLRSFSSSLLYIAGISWQAWSSSTFGYDSSSQYGLLFLLILPFLFYLYRKAPKGNFAAFHNWVIPISLAVSLHAMIPELSRWMGPAYASLFAILFMVGQRKPFSEQSGARNGLRRIGQLGTLLTLFVASFQDHYWHSVLRKGFPDIFDTSTVLGWTTLLILFGIAFVLFILRIRSIPLKRTDPFEGAWLLFLILFLVGFQSGELLPYIGTNLLILGIALHRLFEGGNSGKLAPLNLGASVFTALILCRFFETDMSFLFRGLTFILLGLGFFAMNYRILRKRKLRDE